jgi:two-component system LytT family response regulator
MTPLKCIIVDDEEAARSLLKKIIAEHCPSLEVVGEATDVKSAVKLINKHQIELVFLDIEMPGENGFALFDYFEKPTFETIFCTAYSEFALKAFDVSAVDYVLKPISISKLNSAIDKAIKLIGQNQILQRITTLKENLAVNKLQKIALPMRDSLLFVKVDDILYLEAEGSYTNVIMKDSKTLVTKKIKEFDELLCEDTRFYRVHRSYIVNILQIKKYNKKDGASIEFDDGANIPVAREKVKEFDEFVSELKV